MAITKITAVAASSPGRFYDGIPEPRRRELLDALTALWTHHSTAIEGNTINLGDTMIVLKYGLTISGKTLKEHQEIYGHAKAVECISEFVESGRLTEEDIFELHRLVVTEDSRDIYRPIGGWKREPNGTYGVNGEGKPVYMSYSDPEDVPTLMSAWLKEFCAPCANPPKGIAAAVEAYTRLHVSFVRIHPFFDGNGRIARLIANIPVLRGGNAPIVVPAEKRVDYIRLLWNYQQRNGVLRTGGELAPEGPELVMFRTLLTEAIKPVLELVADAREGK